MQTTVEEMLKLGPLPCSTDADVGQLEIYQSLLAKIDQPIADDDARALITLFGPDDCFGLCWTLLHIVETAPGWPIHELLVSGENEWIDRLRERVNH